MFHSLFFSVFFLFLFFACRTPYGFPQFFTCRPKKKKKPSSMRAPQVQRSSCGVRVCRSTQGSNSIFSFFFLLLSIFTSLSVFSCACYYYFYKLGPGHTNRVTKSLDFPSFFFFLSTVPWRAFFFFLSRRKEEVRFFFFLSQPACQYKWAFSSSFFFVQKLMLAKDRDT